jgi:putative RecB family exonuclease
MAERRYEPALAVQMFYGTVIHQVLDRAHAHYKGLVDPGRADQMPTDEDIEGYFAEVENGLRARRIYAVAGIRDHALTVLKRFNALEGPTLYPRVVDTECRLQADQGTHILHGNVDVLARVAASALQAGVHQDAAQLEIWDYKGTRKPTITSPDFQNYIFQMQVYAELYRRKTGHLPLRGVLYFLNELGGDPPPTARPINATMSVQFDRRGVTQAIDSFRATVADIERCRVIRQWPDPSEAPTEETCDACDVRWNCSAARRFERRYRMIYP